MENRRSAADLAMEQRNQAAVTIAAAQSLASWFSTTGARIPLHTDGPCFQHLASNRPMPPWAVALLLLLVASTPTELVCGMYMLS